ncbi:SCP2 sterol-binding domain-containing protein [Rhodobaculum claviforme]|uniref:Sterol carrier family protein n=1 Tax=Rhodobaculum claviforme TaxID=1549854 RepID=A0A934TGX3_9RHOB|nr:SCP2 sterol-binding domain-containing protein [Rhodobaculum claviforme]MBK5925930.1 sterol carrier family protein [Rhodobaculum claviforme]
MGEIMEQAVAAMRAKFGDGVDGSAKFVIGDLGAVIVDQSGVHAGDGPAQVTLSAEAETFRAILEGDLSPTIAFMSGRLSVEGDMGLALKLANRMG